MLVGHPFEDRLDRRAGVERTWGGGGRAPGERDGHERGEFAQPRHLHDHRGSKVSVGRHQEDGQDFSGGLGRFRDGVQDRRAGPALGGGEAHQQEPQRARERHQGGDLAGTVPVLFERFESRWADLFVRTPG